MKKRAKTEREETPGFQKKGVNRMTVFFNDGFIEEMDTFLKNISIDHRLDSFVKNSKERFSASIRILIANYNKKFKTDVLSKKMEEVKQEEVAHE